MLKKRFKILSEFKTPLPLGKVEGIKFIFPHENGRTLEINSTTILDFNAGIVEIEISDFEVQGLMVGDNQNIMANVLTYDETYTVLFSKCLTVQIKDGRKVWL